MIIKSHDYHEIDVYWVRDAGSISQRSVIGTVTYAHSLITGDSEARFTQIEALHESLYIFDYIW